MEILTGKEISKTFPKKFSVSPYRKLALLDRKLSHDQFRRSYVEVHANVVFEKLHGYSEYYRENKSLCASPRRTNNQ